MYLSKEAFTTEVNQTINPSIQIFFPERVNTVLLDISLPNETLGYHPVSFAVAVQSYGLSRMQCESL